jgi:hypothetical protein
LKDSVKLTGFPAALAALCAVAGIAHGRILFLGHTYADLDYLPLILPLRTYLSEALHAGYLPQWCDALGFGTPFLSNPQNHVLYPPSWLVGVMPVMFANDLIVLVHLVWAGLGMRAFVLRLGGGPGGALFAGAAFLLGGYTSSMVGMGTPLETLSWLPWVAFTADRVAQADDWRERARATAWVAVMLAAAFLAGDPAGVVTGTLLAGVVVVARAPDRGRRLRGLLAVFVGAGLAAALAAMLLVPSFLELRESRRREGVPERDAMLWSMHPFRFVELIIPRAFGDQTSRAHTLTRILADEGEGRDLNVTWAASIYLGFPLLALMVAGLRREDGTRWLALGGLLFVFLAMGDNTPFYPLYRKVMPFERVIRYPERHLAGVMVLWTALGGVGFRRAVLAGPSRRLVVVLIGGAVGLGAIMLLEHRYALALRGYFEAQVRLRDIKTDVKTAIDVGLAGSTSAFVVAVLVAVLMAVRRWSPGAAAHTPALVAAVLVIGFGVESRAALSTVARADVDEMPLLLQPLIGQPADYPGDRGVRQRIYRDRWVPLPIEARPDQYARITHHAVTENVGMRFGLAHVPGYQPGRLSSARLERFFNKVPIVVDVFDVRYLVTPKHKLPPGPKKVINDVPPMVLVETQRMRPRAYVAPRWSWWPTDEAALDGLFPGALNDPGTVRLVGKGPTSPPDHAETLAQRCMVEVERPEDILLRCQSPKGGYAVLLDEWAPGWRAEVDGRPAVIERSDALFRAVAVPAGAHEVRLRYTTPGLWSGLLASALALVAVVGLGMWGRAPRKRQPVDEPVPSPDREPPPPGPEAPETDVTPRRGRRKR